jgi:DNA-directed RNA polymerase specialized sigma24 family protein
MRNLWKNTEQRLSTVNTQRLGDWDEPGGEEADQRVIVNDVLAVVQNLRTRSVAVPALVDYAEGYSMAEIATARGVPLGTVKRRIHDARQMLAKLVNVN